MYDTYIKTTLMIGIIVTLLAACSAAQTPEAIVTPTNTVASPSLPQVMDLGALGKGAVSDVFFSPDGNLLAVRSSTGLYFHDTQTWAVLKTIPARELEELSLSSPTFSPDGQNLVFIKSWGEPHTFWNYHLQTGEFTLLFEDANLSPQSAPVFSPDGASFAIVNSVCENRETEQQTCWKVLELRDSADGQLRHSLQKSDSWQENEITVFVFSPDGKQITIASKDNFARTWDTASGKLLYEFQHDSDVLDLAYSPDGRVLASASNDATVRFWDSQTGKNLATLRGFTQGVQRVVYLDQGQKLLVGEFFTNRFQIYRLNDQFLPIDPLGGEMMLGKRRDPYPRMESTLQTVISPDTSKIAVLLNDTVQIWDLEKGKSILTLPEYHSMIFTWAFNADASMLAVADHNIHLWNVPSKKWLALLPIDAYQIQATAFSPDGRQLAVAADGNLTFWDTATFQKLHEVKTEHSIDALAYTPDSKYLAIVGNGQVQILNAKTGRAHQQFTLKEASYALALHFSADGKQLYYVGSTERLGWNVESGKTLYSIQANPDRYGKSAMTSNLGVYWQWDSEHYYLDPKSNSQWSNAFHFFDPSTGQTLYDFANPGDSRYIPAALSGDGRLLAWNNNDIVDLLDAASGQVLASINSRGADHLSLSLNSRILATQAYMNPIHLWDVSSIAQHAEVSTPLTATPASRVIPASSATPTVMPLAIESLSPSQSSADAIRPENIARLEKLNELGLGQIYAAAWSPDGERIALGGYPSVYIFDMSSSRPLVTLPVEGSIMKLAFSPDGKMLAGQIGNGVIHVWDIVTGQSLHKMDTICLWYADMRFTADGQIFSAQCGWTTYRWNARDGSLIGKKEDKQQVYGSHSLGGNLVFEQDGTTARIVDAKTKKIIRSVEVPEMTPGLGTFSPDGKTLLIWFYQYEVARSGALVPGVDFKSLIQLWNIEAGQMPTLRASLATGTWGYWEGEMGGYHELSFTADSHRLATVSGDQIQVWSVQSGKLLYTLPGGGAVYFSPNGNQIISLDGTVQVWDVTPGKQPVERWKVSGLYEFRNLLALTSDELVTVDDGAFRFRAMNREEITEQPVALKAPDKNMTISAISPDGKWLAYSTATKLMLGRKDAQKVNWQALEEFSDKPFVLGTEAVVFSPDSSTLAVRDADRRVLLWHLNDLESEPIELAREIYVTELIFTPDGKSLLGVPGDSMEERPIYLWDTVTGDLLRTWNVIGDQFAIHPNGATLAVADYQGSEIPIFDLSTWNLVRKLEGDKYIRKIAFSPDGNLLVTSNENGAKFWDVSTGKLLRTIEELRSWLWFFSPDGTLLVSTVGDGRVQVWGVR